MSYINEITLKKKLEEKFVYIHHNMLQPVDLLEEQEIISKEWKCINDEQGLEGLVEEIIKSGGNFALLSIEQKENRVRVKGASW